MIAIEPFEATYPAFNPEIQKRIRVPCRVVGIDKAGPNSEPKFVAIVDDGAASEVICLDRIERK